MDDVYAAGKFIAVCVYERFVLLQCTGCKQYNYLSPVSTSCFSGLRFLRSAGFLLGGSYTSFAR